MAATLKQTGWSMARRIPVEITTIAAFAVAIFGVCATGAAICSAMVAPSPWLVAGAYGGPAALAFGLYWALSHRV
jgi:hypothetical protein